jgi:hypothetical protein
MEWKEVSHWLIPRIGENEERFMGDAPKEVALTVGFWWSMDTLIF